MSCFNAYLCLAGTTLRYKPGFIVGGEVVHDCGKSRGIGYFLEPLILLGLFGRLVGHSYCFSLLQISPLLSCIACIKALPELVHIFHDSDKDPSARV